MHGWAVEAAALGTGVCAVRRGSWPCGDLGGEADGRQEAVWLGGVSEATGEKKRPSPASSRKHRPDRHPALPLWLWSP